MIGMFLPFLKSWWKEIFIVLIIAGGWFYYKHLVNTIEEQRTTIAEQKVVIDGLGAKIKEQNDAVDKLKKDTDDRLAAAKIALAAAQAKGKVNKDRAAAIGNAKPKFPADMCRSADALINEEIK